MLLVLQEYEKKWAILKLNYQHVPVHKSGDIVELRRLAKRLTSERCVWAKTTVILGNVQKNASWRHDDPVVFQQNAAWSTY